MLNHLLTNIRCLSSYLPSYPGEASIWGEARALRSPPHDWPWVSVVHEARKPDFSSDSSVLNLMIMKLEAEVKLLPLSCSVMEPDRVAMVVADSSVRPPPRIWTVSNTFSVSKREN